MRKRHLTKAAVAALMTLAAATMSVSLTMASDESITIGYNQEVGSMDFQDQASAAPIDTIGSYVDATLVVYNQETGLVEPWLASSFEQVDDVTYRFTLRDNAVSHNGFALKAQDVVDSIQRCCDCAGLAKYARHIDPTKSKVIDDLTVELVSTEPYADFLNQLCLYNFNILSTEGVEAEGGYEEEARNPQAGFGPYRFVEWVTGDHFTFERDDDFWGEAPYYKTQIVRIIPDASARVMNLQSGDVDAINEIPPSQCATLEGAGDVDVCRIDNTYKMHNLVFNNSKAPLDDANVRRALSMGFSREAALASVMSNSGIVADGYYGNLLPVYAAPEPDQENHYTYNPDRARELLAEAGYADGFDLTVICMEKQEYSQLAEFIAMQWAELGVNVNVEISDTPTYFSKMNGGEFDVCVIANSGVWYASVNNLDGRLGIEGGGTSAFTDGGDAFYALIDQACANAYGTEANQEALDGIQQIVRDLVPVASVYNAQVIYGLRSGLSGISMMVMGQPSFSFITPEA